MTQKTKKLLVMAGGTGGHVFPALAVAEDLRKQGWEVTWLGTKRGMEAQIVPSHNIELDYVSIYGLRGKSKLSLLLAPLRLLQALLQSMHIIKKRKPDCILGMGGFVAGPGGLAAWLLRKPLVIHEQNAIAGVTNRILSKMAKVVCESFPNTFPAKGKLHTTGNPVREEIYSLPVPEQRFAQRNGKIRLLVLGGSRGAKAINDMVPAALAKIPQEQRPEVWHQCGDKHFDAANLSYLEYGVEATVEPFIKNMAEAYAWADAVICRAGALTVAEIIAAGLPALFIPYPYAVDDHQTKNAQALVDSGAAELIQQTDLSADKLHEIIAKQFSDRTTLLQHAQKARALQQKNATQQIAEFCTEVIRG